MPKAYSTLRQDRAALERGAPLLIRASGLTTRQTETTEQYGKDGQIPVNVEHAGRAAVTAW